MHKNFNVFSGMVEGKRGKNAVMSLKCLAFAIILPAEANVDELLVILW